MPRLVSDPDVLGQHCAELIEVGDSAGEQGGHAPGSFGRYTPVMIANSTIREQLFQHRAEFPFPAAIAGWDVKVGRDSTGDDAVWVWVVLHDDLVEQVWPLQTRDELRDRVREIVRSAAAPTEIQVYVRFRSESEHRGVVGEDWAG